MKNVLTQYISDIWCANILTREPGFKTNSNTYAEANITNAIRSMYTQNTDQHTEHI